MLPCLFGVPSLSDSFNFLHHTTFYPVIIIFTFNVSKPSQPTIFDHQTDWFQFFTLLSFIQLNPHSNLIVPIHVQFNFIGQIRQLAQVAYTLPFSLNENFFQLEWVSIHKTFQAETGSIGCCQVPEYRYLAGSAIFLKGLIEKLSQLVQCLNPYKILDL